jgi:outer membrane autotransporter protein
MNKYLHMDQQKTSYWKTVAVIVCVLAATARPGFAAVEVIPIGGSGFVSEVEILANTTTQVGTPVRVLSATDMYEPFPSCIQNNELGEIVVDRQPANGTISIRDPNRLQNGYDNGQCTGTIPVADAFYIPNPGFVGTDSFVLSGIVPEFGFTLTRTFTVTVQGGSLSQQQSAPVETTQQETTRVATKQIVSIVAKRVSQTVRAATRRVRRRPSAGAPAGDEAGAEPALDRLAGLDEGSAIPLFGYGSGYAAGEDGLRFGVWANGGHTWIENDFANTAFDGTLISGLGGADYWVTDRILLGGFGGFESSDIDTDFNLGEQESDGFTAGVYAAYVLSDNFSVEAQFGVTLSDTDMERRAGVAVPVTGATDSRRLFGSLGFTGEFQIGNFFAGPTVRHLLAQERVDAFTESNGTRVRKQNIDLGVLQAGGRVSYLFGKVEPFLSLLLELETLTTDIEVASGPKPRDDRANGDLSVGVDFYPSDLITGGVELNHKFERENFDETTVSANITFSF